ncbi:MAG TPA: selenocysteine-specific translation elongation factor [Gammaproteobacteria bacterium]|nr:selenocysteine-specific translation elongation factor [Gammaproteobacteria bacterium]
MSGAAENRVGRALTLAVIGHVDHGKTALVRALTGIETDRLDEERERGLSIVLGFAYLSTPHGIVDLIDAPGHEDFVRAMIGGASGVDGVVLCVAANEGVMPQTVEHFNIARLLGVEKGIVVITKADAAADDARAALRQDVERRLRGSFLEGAPVIEASATSGAGIDAVRAALAEMAAAPVARAAHGRFFMPLDRAFTIHGFGLVVTGTLRGGELAVGDAVEIMPRGAATTVRALQNHNRPVERAVPGQRVAANLRHLGRGEVERGDVLAAPGLVVPATRIDVELSLLEDAAAPVKNGAAVRFSTGTTEAVARLRLLDRQAVEPGETAFAQINLERAIATLQTERFLVRTSSPVHTIGGGRILAVGTKRHRRFDASVKERLASAASGDVERIVAHRLEEAGGAGVRCDALAAEIGSTPEIVGGALARLGAVALTEDLRVAPASFAAVAAEVLAELERFHREQPLRKGLDAGSLAGRVRAKAAPQVVQYALRRLVDEGKVETADELFRVAGYDPFARLGERERRLVAEIEHAFLAGGLEPPAPEVVVRAEKVRQVIYALLLETGRLVRLKTYDRNANIVLHAKTVEDVKQAVARKFPYPSQFAVKDVRDLLGSTRKHVVPAMEHLDATGVTVRNGDLRRLREP